MNSNLILIATALLLCALMINSAAANENIGTPPGVREQVSEHRLPAEGDAQKRVLSQIRLIEDNVQESQRLVQALSSTRIKRVESQFVPRLKRLGPKKEQASGPRNLQDPQFDFALLAARYYHERFVIYERCLDTLTMIEEDLDRLGQLATRVADAKLSLNPTEIRQWIELTRNALRTPHKDAACYAKSFRWAAENFETLNDARLRILLWMAQPDETKHKRFRVLGSIFGALTVRCAVIARRLTVLCGNSSSEPHPAIAQLSWILGNTSQCAALRDSFRKLAALGKSGSYEEFIEVYETLPTHWRTE